MKIRKSFLKTYFTMVLYRDSPKIKFVLNYEIKNFGDIIIPNREIIL